VAEASHYKGASVDGRVREWCGEMRWRLGVVLAFYRGPRGTEEAVSGAITAGVNGLCH
jgi:hypothetical protein